MAQTLPDLRAFERDGFFCRFFSRLLYNRRQVLAAESRRGQKVVV